MYVVYGMLFLILKHGFCWKYQYNKYMFNLIDIYSFIPVGDCVGMGSSGLLCPGPILLLRRPEYDPLICHSIKIKTHLKILKWNIYDPYLKSAKIYPSQRYVSIPIYIRSDNTNRHPLPATCFTMSFISRFQTFKGVLNNNKCVHDMLQFHFIMRHFYIGHTFA